jgi:hypothetical protein
VDRFEPAKPNHFDPLARWSRRAEETSLAPLALTDGREVAARS